jgi:hypothetical protein
MNILAEVHYKMTLKSKTQKHSLQNEIYFERRGCIDIETRREFLKERSYRQNQQKL